VSILAILQALLSIAGTLSEYAKNKKLMDAGAATSVAEGLKNAMGAVEKARALRDSVKHDADSVRNDPDNRDP